MLWLMWWARAGGHGTAFKEYKDVRTASTTPCLTATTKVNCELILRGTCAQVGTGSRSEKIKTYNFKDSRVSDHRTKVNYDLNRVLEGDLEASIQSLIALDQQEQLAALVSENGA